MTARNGLFSRKHPVSHGIHDLFPGPEMVIDRAFCQTIQFIHDILYRGIVIPLLQKETLPSQKVSREPVRPACGHRIRRISSVILWNDLHGEGPCDKIMIQ